LLLNKYTYKNIYNSSKLHRALGLKLTSSIVPELKRSSPAKAIIAALSVHNFIGGATKLYKYSCETNSRVDLKTLLAATPPATTKFLPVAIFSYSLIAYFVFL
jgi:hypothetical protein